MCTTTETIPDPSPMKLSKNETDVDDVAETYSDVSVGLDTLATASVTTDSNTESEATEESEDDLPETPPPIPSPATIKKNVSFGTLESFSFPVVEGDPNFELAYPMTLGWECWGEASFSVDEYEANRPTRRTQNELRTMSEDRRRIIKDSKKEKKQRQRQSIANGEIGRDPRRNLIPAFLLSAMTGTTNGSGSSDSKTPNRRGTLRRQNSIGNGEMTRDPRRNSTQGFMKSLMTGSKQSSSKTENDSDREMSKSDSGMDTTGRRGGLKRQNSIGNGEMTRDPRRNSTPIFLVSLITSSKPAKRNSGTSDKKIAADQKSSEASKDAADPNKKPTSRPGTLKRQNSIGNGEITRLSAKSASKQTNGESNSPPDKVAAASGSRRGGLRRQNSIGNGEITRHKRRNSVQDFIKRMTTSSSSSKQGSSTKQASTKQGNSTKPENPTMPESPVIQASYQVDYEV